MSRFPCCGNGEGIARLKQEGTSPNDEKTYYLMAVLATVAAFILVCMMSGFGPYFSNPIDPIYAGFMLCLSIVYHVVKHPAR